MICSLNEVDATLRKAAVGAGLMVGLADAVAAAGVWLCAQELDGVGSVLDAVLNPDPVRQPNTKTPGDGSTLTFSGTSVGWCGPSVFEVLEGTGIDRVVVETPDAPLLLVGFAGVAAQTTGRSYTLNDGTGNSVHVAAQAWSGSAPLTGATQLEAACSTWVPTAEKSLPNGVVVNADAWASALSLAQRTYVPATEESRLHGAGAGLTDND